MANYPTSDPSFAAKNTGDTVQASHVNALQDEVVAIGAALRGTLQHAVTVGTGGLTVSTGNTVLGQNLSVAGTSTFAGIPVMSTGLTVSTGPTVLGQSLSVAGDSTFAGAVTFSSAVAFRHPFTVPTASTTLSGGSTRFDNVVLPSTAVLLRVDGNSTAIAISGLSTRGGGSVLFLANVEGAAAITLLNEDVNSSATCRMQFGGANRTVAAGGMTTLIYDGVTGRWRG